MTLTFAPPPETPVEPVTEVLHGVSVTDPYRWLEDQNSPRTRKWLEAQTAYARSYLDVLRGKDRLRKRISELLDTEVISEPWKVGDRYFFAKRSRGEEQPTLMMREAGSAFDLPLVSPTETGDGTRTAIGILGISHDGKLLAYSVRQGGVDAYSVGFLDVEQRRIMTDRLPYGYCLGLVFCPNGEGIYYSHVTPETACWKRRSVRLHKFGTNPECDIEVFSMGKKQRFHFRLTSAVHGRSLGYVVVSSDDPPRTDVYLHDLTENRSPQLIVEGVEGCFLPMFMGNQLLVLTDRKAPNFRVIAIDPAKPEENNWSELVPECGRQIHDCAVVGDSVFVVYVEKCSTRVEIYDRAGQRRGALPCPDMGTVRLIPCQPESDKLFYQVTSYARPPEIWAYHEPTGTAEAWAKSQVPFDPSSFEVRHTVYPSKDGTEIPISLMWKKGIRLAGAAFLTGYGGFGVSITPQFAVYATILMEHGLLFAVANLRGGAEFGHEWHLAGKRHNRQNAIDDFISAAEWLLANKHAACGKLAIGGGSNAGLLVAAAMTQRPDLFRAVLCQGPLLDMLRYHKFDMADLWISEFGSADVSEDFPYLNAYSPYHRVKSETAYPAVMLISGDCDSRCNPMHSRKMAARLQAESSSPHPILLDYRPNWGHAAVQPLTSRIDALTDRLAFLLNEVGIRN